MKLDKIVLANASALATAILWTICSIFVWLLPNFAFTVSQWWMHGLDISIMGNWNLTLTNFIAGGITLIISAWVTGYVFGWAWKKTSGKH